MDYYIELFFAIEEIRNLIYFFNMKYRKNRMQTDVEALVSKIQKIDEIASSDKSVYSGSMREYAGMILEYAKSQDFTAVYDIVNGGLFWDIIKIAEHFYARYAREMTEYFWGKNREALRTRYPKILKEIENLKEEDFARPYGLRGKVVYRKGNETEYDLYSAYHPVEVGCRMTEMTFFEAYDKVCLWGCNGGFELDGILHGSASSCLNMEIYVTDLREFKHIMMHTKRDGGILSPNLHWKFHVGAGEFFKRFPLEEKEGIYLYVSRYYKNGREAFERFAVEHSIPSNAGRLK